MRKNYEIVIVGGGIQGLSLAYNLALSGMSNVVVLDKSYIGSGASSRNGEMIRSAFASEQWIRFFTKSIEIWDNLAHQLDFNVMFTRCGYLVLASTDDELKACHAHVKLQKTYGLETCLLNSDEVVKLIPAINPAMVCGGILQPNGGFARHDAALWAYARAASRLNVDIFPFTEVTGIVVKSGAVQAVKTSLGEIETRIIVNAAGGHAGRIADMVGLALPSQTYRLEIMATEPLKPFLPLALSSPHTLSYMHQSTRGEFVGGAEVENLAPSTSLRSSLGAARNMADKFIRLFPGLAGVRLMRQWAGIVDMAPDVSPVLGPVDEVKGFILNCGWVYGFMGAPAAGKLLADYILTGEMPAEIRPFGLARFKSGQLILDSSLVVPSERL
ncbi:MAG: FAD-binding oxidoreductase [Desulfobacterales bacterium]